MSKTNKILFTISCILVVLSLYVSIQISYAIPQFEKLFEGFKTEISGSTKFVLEYHYLGLIMPLIAMFASIYFIKSNPKQTSKNIIYVLTVITIVITLTWQVYAAEAMYAPIMNMKTQ